MNSTGLEAFRATFAPGLLSVLWGVAVAASAIAWFRGLPTALSVTLMALGIMAFMTIAFL